jgi:hypothetical protein
MMNMVCQKGFIKRIEAAAVDVLPKNGMGSLVQQIPRT